MSRTDRAERTRMISVTDATGRELGLRRPGVLHRLALLEAIGPENARNEQYLRIANLAAAVVEIDGEPCEPIAAKHQLEARVQQLDEPGLDAAARAFAVPSEDEDGAEGTLQDLAQKRLEDSELTIRLSLVMNGIPFREAFDLAPDEPFPLDASWALTFYIGFGLLNGARYDWKAGRWRP